MDVRTGMHKGGHVLFLGTSARMDCRCVRVCAYGTTEQSEPLTSYRLRRKSTEKCAPTLRGILKYESAPHWSTSESRPTGPNCRVAGRRAARRRVLQGAVTSRRPGV